LQKLQVSAFDDPYLLICAWKSPERSRVWRGRRRSRDRTPEGGWPARQTQYLHTDRDRRVTV